MSWGFFLSFFPALAINIVQPQHITQHTVSRYWVGPSYVTVGRSQILQLLVFKIYYKDLRTHAHTQIFRSFQTIYYYSKEELAIELTAALHLYSCNCLDLFFFSCSKCFASTLHQINYRHAAVEIRPHTRSNVRVHSLQSTTVCTRDPSTANCCHCSVTAVTRQLLLQWFHFGQLNSVNLKNKVQKLAMSFIYYINNQHHMWGFFFNSPSWWIK